MNTTIEDIYTILQGVTDPEIPVLTIQDLGVLRKVDIEQDEQVAVFITPTYSGCPAMDMITVNIKSALQEHGIDNCRVEYVLSPAWTTEWITAAGRQKLKEYGIAPPSLRKSSTDLFDEGPQVNCPRCGSESTTLLSQFGSTACKALYQCDSCKEPFDYFKCH